MLDNARGKKEVEVEEEKEKENWLIVPDNPRK